MGRARYPHATKLLITADCGGSADQFFLLGVDRDRRFARRQRVLHLFVDVLELGVAVGMVRPLAGLPIGLQAVSEVAQKIGDHVVRDAMPETSKLGRQIAQALGGPPQRRHRIAACRRLHQGSEIAEQRRIGVHEGRASGPLPAHPTRRRLGRRLAAQFRQPATDRAARNAGDPRDGHDPATPSRQRFRRCKPTSPALVQHRIERRIP